MRDEYLPPFNLIDEAIRFFTESKKLPSNFESPIPEGQVANKGNTAFQQVLQSFISPKTIAKAPAQAVQGVSTQATPTPTPLPVEQQIANGFNKYGRPELADQAKYFAQAGEGLPDPLLPAVIALKESSGGKTNKGANNLWNIMNPDHTPVNYPDLKTALLGGVDHPQGLKGILHNGIYDDYLKSKKLKDFFKHFTPAADNNPSYNTQIDQYNELEKYYQ